MSAAKSKAASSERASRRFDLVVWGATGFTGRLVAEYLVTHAGPEVKWAIAGRNREALERVRAGLAELDPGARELPIVLADSHDVASLEAMAASTRVVCSTVGPFAKYGSELVAACVEKVTDYCDITGEVQWIRRMVDAHHERAKERGARIVHCCGFDSIPSDLGTLMMHEHAQRVHGAQLESVAMRVRAMRGGASGGTVASMLTLVEEAQRDPAVRRALGDPYALVPGAPRGPDKGDRMWPTRDEGGRLAAPFVMAAVNTRVVRRSNALLDYAYGADFRYDEATSFADSPKGFLEAYGMSLGLAAVVPLAAFGPTRNLLQRSLLPGPGEGPSREARERGFFHIDLLSRARLPDGRSLSLVGRVEGKADPGYGETSKMLGEAALCLALDERPTPLSGVLTPASAMGMRLIDRLRAAGMVFEVREAREEG